MGRSRFSSWVVWTAVLSLLVVTLVTAQTNPAAEPSAQTGSETVPATSSQTSSEASPGIMDQSTLVGSSTPSPAVRYAQPGNVEAADLPNDSGHGILVQWDLSPDDERILVYDIYRVLEAGAPEESWVLVGTVPRGTTQYEYVAEEPMMAGAPNPAYVPRGGEVGGGGTGPGRDRWPLSLQLTSVGRSPGQLVPHTGKVNVLVVVLVFGFGVVYFIRQARKGKGLYVRPIPGIDAVDEAIGRATEMGRPILFVLGTGTAGDIATIAGYTVLARVAKKSAEYQTQILVPVNDPVMMAMAQETVREAYMEAGRPDVFRAEDIFYISAMQFPYVAAVNGVMMQGADGHQLLHGCLPRGSTHPRPRQAA